MLLHTQGKAEKYIKNNTLKLNDYLKKNASPRAMKASLWQDNWQQQKAKSTADTSKDTQKSAPKKAKSMKKDAPERSERPDNREQKKTSKKTKKETGKTDSKNTQSDPAKTKGKETETDPKNTMISKKSSEASDLITMVQNLDETTHNGDDTTLFVQKEITKENNDNTLDASKFFETDANTDGKNEDKSNEPAWDFFQKQADVDPTKDTDKTDGEQSLDPALAGQPVANTQKIENTTSDDNTETKGKQGTVTIEKVVTADPSQQKKTDDGLKTGDKTNKDTGAGDKTNKDNGAGEDALKASKVENPEKITTKETSKTKQVDKSINDSKGGEKINLDKNNTPLEQTQIRDTLKNARTVEQKVARNPESVDMSDLEKIADELRKIEEKTSTEKRLEKATLEAAGIRRNLENKMLEKQAVQTMMMERNALENNQRTQIFNKTATPTQTDTTTQAPTTPVNPMMAPVAPPMTRGATSLSTGLDMSNLASGGGTGGDSGGNNGGGQNKGDQQQGSYTAPKSEGRILLDLTQQRNWQKTLAVRALQIAQGKGEARMQLHPAEMGALIVRVQVRDGATRINVIAEKEEATKLLGENRQILEQSFKEQGMDFQEFNLAQGNASDFSGENGDKDKDDKPSFAQELEDKTQQNQDGDDEKTIIKTDRLVDTMV